MTNNNAEADTLGASHPAPGLRTLFWTTDLVQVKAPERTGCRTAARNRALPPRSRRAVAIPRPHPGPILAAEIDPILRHMALGEPVRRASLTCVSPYDRRRQGQSQGVGHPTTPENTPATR